jgi:hypothetical protein
MCVRMTDAAVADRRGWIARDDPPATEPYRFATFTVRLVPSADNTCRAYKPGGS